MVGEMIRLFTPLVLGTTFVVSVLAVGRITVSPDSWISSIVALSFLPLALGAIALQARLTSKHSRSMKAPGKIRAALVGAGAALAAALLLSIAEEIGFSDNDVTSNWGIAGTLLVALVAVAVDLYIARLEQKASDDD